MFAHLGENVTIQKRAIVGFRYRKGCRRARIGDNSIIRAFTVIYADVEIGCDLQTGHHALIREFTNIGNGVVVGSGTIIDGQTVIGDLVKIESRVYIPAHTRIGNRVFIGPGVVMTNDRYPQRLRSAYQPQGPVLQDGVSVGANVTILPG
ncbi:MAG: N-acetyltransferase, partial [Dehalococcoidia bacterium]